MAVRMRLMRMGKKKQPVYRVVVMDQRAPRDGRYIEQIGRYDARQEPSLVEIDNERATHWLSNGAQPSETVEKLLNICGAMDTMKVQTGGIHVVAASPAEAGEVEESGDSPAVGAAEAEESGDSPAAEAADSASDAEGAATADSGEEE